MGLVIVLLAVIIGASAWVVISLQPPPPPPERLRGDVYVLQQDIFFVFINDAGQVQIDYMIGRYGGGTFGGNQPLNVSLARTFEDQVNFTIIDPYLFYDYFGNAYYIPPEIGSDSLEFEAGNINPNMWFDYEEQHFRGGSTMRGYYSLIWDYIINSTDNIWLQTDTMEDMYTFTFDIHPENDTLPYNTPTIVHCNITFNTLSATDTNIYNYGESKIIFPKQVYNDTILLANISVHEVTRIGSIITGDPNPTIDNETHIGFQANPITTSMSQNQSWGYTFDLNVTSFSNNSYCLLDLTTPENEFFMQTGFTGIVLEQPMHFPKAQNDILTPFYDRLKKNFTDIEFRFPEIRLNNGTMSYHVPPDAFGPRSYPIPPLSQEPESRSIAMLEGIVEDSSDLDLKLITWFTELRRLPLVG